MTEDAAGTEEMMRKNCLVITLVLLCILGTGVSGCVVNRIMETQEKEAYARYRIQAERLNLEREKSGLPPQEIMPYEAWNTREKP